MRRYAIALALLVILAFAVPASAATDPFTCDPSLFTFDFPLKCASPYESISQKTLINSNSKADYELSFSIWGDYYAVEHKADPSWFSFNPATGPLPGGSSFFTQVVCTPPLCELQEWTYETFLKITAVNDPSKYRVYRIQVRIGDAVPQVDYAITGFLLAEINGNEGHAYTQSQLTIGVNNQAATANEFALHPMVPNDPSSDPIDPSTAGDYRKLKELWKDPTAQKVYCEALPSTWNEKTRTYTEFRLYTLAADGSEVPFGTFLGGSSKGDSTPKLAYPFKIEARRTAEVPFTLRVNREVPTGIYLLQIRVTPCGISTAATGGTALGVQYACKIPLQVNRVEGSSAGGSPLIPFILIGVGGALLLYLGGLYGYRKLRVRVEKRRYAQSMARGRSYPAR